MHCKISKFASFTNPSGEYYHKFLTKYEKEYMVHLNAVQATFIEFISKKLASGKRVHELEMIKYAINNTVDLMSKLKHILKEEYDITLKDSTETSIVNVLTNQFASGSAKSTYKDCIFLEKDGLEYKTSDVFIENFKNEEFKKIVVELIDFGIDRYKKSYSDHYTGCCRQFKKQQKL